MGLLKLIYFPHILETFKFGTQVHFVWNRGKKEMVFRVYPPPLTNCKLQPVYMQSDLRL